MKKLPLVAAIAAGAVFLMMIGDKIGSVEGQPDNRAMSGAARGLTSGILP
jgi:hypothetical protein